MKIIEPKVELWQQEGDAKAHIARCARVCYGRTSGNDEATIKRLIDSEHWSMFRHGTYYIIANDSFNKYKLLVDIGMHRQDARGVLPLDTATRCVYTYSLREWRAIIDLRYYGTTGKPHPNAKIIAGMIRNNLMELGYDFRD